MVVRLNLQVGGLFRALAMSSMLGITVLIPFPRPSILVCNRGILYRCESAQLHESTHVELVVDISTDIDGRHGVKSGLFSFNPAG